MSDTRGVFSLRELYELKTEDQWVPLNEVWAAPSPYFADTPNISYFGGQNLTVGKIDFSDDSFSSVPSVPTSWFAWNRWKVGNNLFGYLSLGPANTTNVGKLSYSTATGELVPTIPSDPGSISPGQGASAIGNAIHGYIGPTSPQSLTHKITYSTDLIEFLPTSYNLSIGPSPGAPVATVGNPTNGYFFANGPIVKKIEYSSENISTVPSTGFVFGGANHNASGNANAGYIGGAQGYSYFQKFTYSANTASRLPASGPPYIYMSPSVRLQNGTSTGNSTHGYFLWGQNTFYSNYEKIEYSSDTIASNPVVPAPFVREQQGSIGPRVNALPFSSILHPALPGLSFNLIGEIESPNMGYFNAGNKYNFSNETTTLVPSAYVKNPEGKSSGNTTHGYYFGGVNVPTPTPSSLNVTHKVSYADDTASSTPVASLPNLYERKDHTVIGNQNNAYLFGSTSTTAAPGFVLSQAATYYSKFTYSTDTFATSPFPKPIPSPTNKNYTSYAAAIGNQTHGYLTGGLPQSTEVWRMVYSTDTIDSTPAANTQAPAPSRFRCAGVGNHSAGYFCGGGGVSHFEKFQYVTDTISSVPGLPNLSHPQQPAMGSGTGNSTHGYVNPNSTTYISKISYSTDTSEVGSTLQSQSGYNTGVGPREFGLPFKSPPDLTPTPQYAYGNFPISNNGYFIASAGAPQKINFANNTLGGVPSLAARSGDTHTLQNSTNAYVFKTAFPATNSKVFLNAEVEYSVPSIPTSSIRAKSYGCGNSTDGYLLGGGATDGSSYVNKIVYSSDTSSPMPNAPLTMGLHAAAGNSTHGYFAGGRSGTSVTQSHMQRIIYSTGTIEAVPGANLSLARESLSAAGNSTHGYFVGGDSAGSKTTIDRITYATDTINIVSTNMYPNTSISPGSNSIISTGNSTHGYFNHSTQDSLYKLQYTTSTSTPFPNLMTTIPRFTSFSAAFSAKENGFPQSGDINQLNRVYV